MRVLRDTPADAAEIIEYVCSGTALVLNYSV
jgi:hypothetical protein